MEVYDIFWVVPSSLPQGGYGAASDARDDIGPRSLSIAPCGRLLSERHHIPRVRAIDDAGDSRCHSFQGCIHAGAILANVIIDGLDSDD